MNTKIASFVLVIVLVTMACSLTPGQQPDKPQVTATDEIDSNSTLKPTAAPTRVSAGTPEEAAKAYYDAWLKSDADQLTNLISDFSLQYAASTRESVRAELKKKIFNGLVVEEYEVLESRILDDTTALVRVITQERQGLGEPSTHDQWAAFRLENGEWRLNWNNIVDVMPLATPAQTINGLEIQLVEVRRFTDHLKIMLHARNTSAQAVQWGWTNDVTVTAFFPDQSSNDLRFSFAFEPNRTYTDRFAKLEGVFEEYPDRLRLSNFMSTNQQGLPIPGGAPWSYEFSLMPATMPITPAP
jgi:hypothetical protein